MKTRPPAEFATTSEPSLGVMRLCREFRLGQWYSVDRKEKPTTSGRHAGLDKLGDKALRRHTSQLKRESGRRDNR